MMVGKNVMLSDGAWQKIKDLQRKMKFKKEEYVIELAIKILYSQEM